MKHVAVCLLYLLLFSAFTKSQEIYDYENPDSLLAEHTKPQPDSVHLELLNKLYVFNINNPELALNYSSELKKLAERTKTNKAITCSYSTLAWWYMNHSDKPDTARIILRELYSKMKTENYVPGMAVAYRGIGRSYIYNRVDSAIFYLTKSMELSKSAGDSNNYYNAKINLANAYNESGLMNEAVATALSAVGYFNKTGQRQKAAATYGNLSQYYSKSGNYEMEIKYVELAGAYNTFTNTTNTAMQYLSLAAAHLRNRNYYEAEKLYKEAEQIGHTENINHILWNAYNGFAEIAFARQQWDEAIRYENKAWEVSEKDLAKEIEKYEMLYRAWHSKGDYQQAFENFKQYDALRDSFAGIERLKNADALEAQFKNREKQTQIELLDKEVKLKQAEADKQKLFRYYIILVFVLVAIVAAILFSRFRQRAKQKQEAERARISRDLHDDIGATLGSISIYSEVAKNKAGSAQDIQEVLTKIGESSRETLDKMNDIVWSVNPENDNAEELIQRMKNFAAAMLTQRNIAFSFNTGETNFTDLKLDMQKRKNIFLIYKECLHNIVKYADAQQVEIDFLISGKRLHFSVKDDGKGFSDSATAYNGNGIKNMKARAAEINAVLEIQSAANKGTTINLKMEV